MHVHLASGTTYLDFFDNNNHLSTVRKRSNGWPSRVCLLYKFDTISKIHSRSNGCITSGTQATVSEYAPYNPRTQLAIKYCLIWIYRGYFFSFIWNTNNTKKQKSGHIVGISTVFETYYLETQVNDTIRDKYNNNLRGRRR